MQRQLSLAELARRLGEPVEVLARWRDLGLIGAAPFDFEDLEHLRFIRLLLRRGAAVADIVEGRRRGQWAAWLRPYFEARFHGLAVPAFGLDEAAAAAGLAPDFAAQLWAVLSISDREDPLSADDVQMMRLAKIARDTGFPPEAILQVARVFGDALAHAVETASRLFHLYVHERLRHDGISAADERDWAERSRQRLDELAEPVVLYFFRRGYLRAARRVHGQP